MKIALCISGQMRTYKNCYDLLYKNILVPLNPDVFIHTWSNSGVSNKVKSGIDRESRDISESVLHEMYTPEMMVIEDFEAGFTDSIDGISVPEILKEHEPLHYKGSLPMYYKMYQCNELKKTYESTNNFEYDRVIRMRPDLAFYEHFPDVLFGIDDYLWHSDLMIDQSFQVSDKLAFGNSKVMDYYTSVYRMLKKYWETPLGEPGIKRKHRVGERLMKYHMDISDIQVNSFNNRCELVRENIETGI